MATWEQIRHWDPERVGKVADELISARNDVVSLQDELDASTPKVWHTDAAETSKQELATRREELEQLAAEIAALAEMVEVSEGDVRQLRDGVERADDNARRNEFRIENDGSVVDASDGEAGGVFRGFQESSLKVLVAGLLASAQDIDKDLLAVMNDVLNGKILDRCANDLADAAEAGRRRVELSEIVEDYQTDAEEMVWFDVPFKDPVLVTESEAKMLKDLSMLELKAMSSIRGDANDAALDRYPGSEAEDGEAIDHTHANAFKHAYWNALMVRKFGPEWTEEYATAHEKVPGNTPHNEAMDLHNNDVGRRIATENPDASPEELADLIQQAEKDGELVVLDKEGQLKHSDDVPHGATGFPDQDRNPAPEAPDDDPGDVDYS